MFFQFCRNIAQNRRSLPKSQNVHKICPLHFEKNDCKFAQLNFADFDLRGNTGWKTYQSLKSMLLFYEIDRSKKKVVANKGCCR